MTEPIEKDVVHGVELGIPADAQLENRRDRGACVDATPIGRIHAAHDLQQRALARPVAPHDAERFAAPDVEADAVEHLEALETGEAAEAPSRCSRTVSRRTLGIQNAFDTRVDFDERHGALHVFRRARAQPPER